MDQEKIDSIKRLVYAGDTVRLAQMLDATPTLATTYIDPIRTLLHVANDFPGGYRNGANVIRLIVDRGADINAPTQSAPGETALHWAASNDALEPVQVLLDLGANTEALGSVIGGGPPIVNAVVFQKVASAQALIDAGCSYTLALAAGADRLDRCDACFSSGAYIAPSPLMPHLNEPIALQAELDQGFIFACRGGFRPIAESLLARGANPAARSPIGTTALSEAEENGHTDIARWLNAMQ